VHVTIRFISKNILPVHLTQIWRLSVCVGLPLRRVSIFFQHLTDASAPSLGTSIYFHFLRPDDGQAYVKFTHIHTHERTRARARTHTHTHTHTHITCLSVCVCVCSDRCSVVVSTTWRPSWRNLSFHVLTTMWGPVALHFTTDSTEQLVWWHIQIRFMLHVIYVIQCVFVYVDHTTPNWWWDLGDLGYSSSHC
jgi:hypothetical protein